MSRGGDVTTWAQAPLYKEEEGRSRNPASKNGSHTVHQHELVATLSFCLV